MTRSTAAANNADQDGAALQQQQLQPQDFQPTPDNITAIASALANNPAFSQGLGASILNAGGDAALLQAVTKRVADTYEERDAKKRQRTEQLLLLLLPLDITSFILCAKAIDDRCKLDVILRNAAAVMCAVRACRCM